jgi:cytoskeletal protein CcmA (bactofilin family)
MFGKSKDDNNQLPIAVQQQPQSLAAKKPTERMSTDHISTIGRSMTVVGKIVVDEGAVHVFGQIEGELRALTILVGEGAKVEGDLVAEELTIGGIVKGTIHASRVKLNSTADVEGDIFHRSLSIEENARFEGLSKRKDNAGDVPRALPQHPAAEAEVQTEAAVIQGERKSNGTAGHDESFSVGVA